MTTDSPVDVAEKTLASGQASGANDPSHHPLGSPSLVTSCSPQAPCTRRQGQRHAKHYRVREGALRRFVCIFPSPHKHFIGPWADSGRGPGRTPRDLLTPVRPTDMARWRGLWAHLPAKAPTAPEGYHLPHQPHPSPRHLYPFQQDARTLQTFAAPFPVRPTSGNHSRC